MFNEVYLSIFYSYGVVLFLINVRTISILLVERRQFSSAYYLIFAYLAINSCCLYILNNYSIRLPSVQILYDIYYSKFGEWSRWNSPIAFIRLYCSYCNVLGQLLLSINRFTAIVFYQRHERWWNNYKVYWLGIFFVAPLLFSFQELFNKTKFLFIIVNNNTFVKLISDNGFNPISNVISSLFVLSAFCLIELVFCVISLTLWKKMKAKIPAPLQSIELRLLMTTSVLFVVGIFALLLFVVPIFYPTDAYTSYIAYVLVSDMAALICPLTILLVSPTIRSHFLPERWTTVQWMGVKVPFPNLSLFHASSQVQAVNGASSRFSNSESRPISLIHKHQATQKTPRQHPNALV